MNLDLTLKAVGVLMIVSVGVEFAVADRLSLPPAILANVFFILGIFARDHARRIAVIAFGFACIVPISAYRGFLNGDAHAITLAITVVAAAYLAFVAYTTFRKEASALMSRIRPPAGDDDA